MKCPGCNKDMTITSDFELRYCLDEDGLDLDKAYMKVFTSTCKTCNIKFKKDEFSGPFSKKDEWILPDKLKPSEKQIKFVENIALKLNKSIDNLVTKNQYWNFIKQNEDKYKKVKDRDYQSRFTSISEEVCEIFDEDWFC